MEELRHSVSIAETNSESSVLTASIPMALKLYPASASWAFFNTDCKYFPWASIRSCKCLCT
ncbi:hypothetical protein C4D60_Mb09t23790 [Musa balbisiana]|uniref:Uncharacterized protein n=1 Tax=Musa balbisiana TaxID=52838 RepID=A0A4S8IIK5_MUSBA|nr:hypothetical protein C4D60_Mb09t23790 [Musa balbisiana]